MSPKTSMETLERGAAFDINTEASMYVVAIRNQEGNIGLITIHWSLH
jgi:hypothetical protein